MAAPAMDPNEEPPELAVVVPTYEERDNLPTLVERIDAALGGRRYRIVVVDDDSPDGTADAARSLGERYPVDVIVRREERGLASAVVDGIRRSASRYVAVIDADLQHPPELLPGLLAAVEDADVAVACRYTPGGGVGAWSLPRRAVSKGATLLAHLILPAARLTPDPMSGYFLLRREVVEGAALDPLGYKILLEILARGAVGRVAAVPYTFETRLHGASKLGFREQVHYLRHLLRLRFSARRRS